MNRAAVVTGSNKGIGYGIVSQLCQHFDGIVYLTARNPELGASAVGKLKTELKVNESAKLKFHQLDITNLDSVTKLKEHLVKEHGGLDILVNNAGIAYKTNSTVPFGEQAEVTCMTNYFGTKRACEMLFTILRPHSRVVNVCSRGGMLSSSYSPSLKSKLTNNNLTVEELDDVVTKFVELAKQGKHTSNGYPGSAYGMSKAAEIALSHIQHRQVSTDTRQDIVINWCCPGYVATDMSSYKGTLSIGQGADTPVYLALLPPNVKEPRGQFVAERKVINWF